MAAELIYTLLRFGFLILLWFFIWLTVSPLTDKLDSTGKASIKSKLKHRRSSEDNVPVKRPAVAPTAQSGKPAGASAQNAYRTTSPTTFRYLAVTGGEQTGTMVPLNGSVIVVGRSQRCQLVLTDTYSSGQHARFYQTGHQWFVEDLNSTNGTFVDGQPLKGALPLSTGVQVRIGQTVLELIK